MVSPAKWAVDTGEREPRRLSVASGYESRGYEGDGELRRENWAHVAEFSTTVVKGVGRLSRHTHP